MRYQDDSEGQVGGDDTPSRRRLFLLGGAGVLLMVMLCVGIVALVLSLRTGTYISPVPSTETTAPTPTLRSLTPISSPTAVATLAPTATPLPTSISTPSPTPMPTLNTLYWIGIADFAGESESLAGLSARIEKDLRAALQDYALNPVVEVKPVTRSVKTVEEAQALAAEVGCDVLIWGESDAAGVYLHILLPQNPYYLESAWERGPDAFLFVLLDQISVSKYGDTAFHYEDAGDVDLKSLFLFTIGQLHAFSGNAEAAKLILREAMDAAVRVPMFEDEANQHFFTAYTASDDQTQICEYARAIQSNPDFSEAYNNLDLLFVRVAEENPLYFQLPCIEEAGIAPYHLLQRAAQTRPGWVAPLYNQAARGWNKATASLSVELPTLRSDFDSVIEVEPNLPIVRVVAGNLAVWDGDYETAIEHFSVARDFWPASSEVAVNLGSALTLAGRKNEAKAVYEEVLSQLSFDGIGERTKEETLLQTRLYLKASIPLIDIYQETGDFDKARNLYKATIYFLQQYPYEHCAFPIGLAKYHVNNQDWQGAKDYLANVNCFAESKFVYDHILWSIAAIQEPDTIPYGSWSHDGCVDHFLDTMVFDYVSQATTCKILGGCNLSTGYRFTIADIDGNACLPAEPEARLLELYDAFMQAYLQELFLARRSVRYYPAACPYVFTYDVQSQNWQVDTTILYNLNAPEKGRYQTQALQRFDGRLWLRELEPETSYIDHLYVRVLSTDGTWHTLQPDNPLLFDKDAQYLVLDQDDEHLLTFDLPVAQEQIQKAWVIAYGYYVPYGQETSNE